MAKLTITGAVSISVDIPFDSVEMGYSNEFQENASVKNTHPEDQRWKSGKMDNFHTELVIAAGITEGLSRGKDVAKKMGEFMSAGIQRRFVTLIPTTITVQIDGFFRCVGYMENVKAIGFEPWDTDGTPMVAEISFDLIPDGTVHIPAPGDFPLITA